MNRPAPNPFAPAPFVEGETGVFGDAVLLKKGFLFRSIKFNLSENAPHSTAAFSLGRAVASDELRENLAPCHVFTLTYSGWWFVQRVHADRVLVWWAISWLRIRPSIKIQLLPKTLGEPKLGFPRDIKLEIDFSKGLKIRRFRVWLDQEIRYDEIS